MSDIAKASWDVLETGESPSVSFFPFTYLVNGLAPWGQGTPIYKLYNMGMCCCEGYGFQVV